MQRFHQLGYVTNALDHARRIFADLHGVKHFRERERTIACERFGVRGTAVLRVALANMPGVQIELIQPVTGQIEVYADTLQVKVSC
jgi:Glyoxalase/Bleomycin resistance protein/Dioxygenase superfamily